MFDEHILKILTVRGIHRDCIVDWEALRQIYLGRYHTTMKETQSTDAAYVDAAEVVIAYLEGKTPPDCKHPSFIPSSDD
jgi:hypothetical protein